MKKRALQLEAQEIAMAPRAVPARRRTKTSTPGGAAGGKRTRMGGRPGRTGSAGGKAPDTFSEEEISGPHAMVYVSKVENRTPEEEVKKILGDSPSGLATIRNHDYYTLLLNTSIQMDDPTTTRLALARVEFDFPEQIKILDYTPRDKSMTAKLTRTGGTEVKISPSLGISATATQGAKVKTTDTENTFEIKVGPEAKIEGSYGVTSGYTLEIPAYSLLEYEGLQKNDHEVQWEIYGDTLDTEHEIPGKMKHAVFSIMVQTPRDTPPGITAHVEGKVKKKVLFLTIDGSVYLAGGNVPRAS